MNHLFYTALSLRALLLIGLVVAVMLTVCSARAEDWQFASSNKQGDIFEIDLDSLAVWQDHSISVKMSMNGEEPPLLTNFDCSGHFIVLSPPNDLGVRRVVPTSSTARIEREVCALRDHVLAEAK